MLVMAGADDTDVNWASSRCRNDLEEPEQEAQGSTVKPLVVQLLNKARQGSEQSTQTAT
jgi:hypothetical protein